MSAPLSDLYSVRTMRRANVTGEHEDVALVTVALPLPTVTSTLEAEPLASGLLPADAIRDVGQPVVDALQAHFGGGE